MLHRDLDDDAWRHEEGGDTYYIKGFVPKVYKPKFRAFRPMLLELSRLPEYDYRGIELGYCPSLFNQFEQREEFYKQFFNSVPHWVEILDISDNFYDSNLLDSCQELLQRPNLRFLIAVRSFGSKWLPQIADNVRWLADNWTLRCKVIYVSEIALKNHKPSMPPEIFKAHEEYYSLQNKFMITNHGNILIHKSVFEVDDELSPQESVVDPLQSQQNAEKLQPQLCDKKLRPKQSIVGVQLKSNMEPLPALISLVDLQRRQRHESNNHDLVNGALFQHLMTGGGIESALSWSGQLALKLTKDREK